jgi:aminopeptidase
VRTGDYRLARTYSLLCVKGEWIERLAALTVETGANVQPGQILAVMAGIESAPLVRAIAGHAYRRGARFVDPIYVDTEVKRIRIEHAVEDTLEFVPSWWTDRLLQFGEQRCARIMVHPTVQPGGLAGLDPGRAGKDLMPALKETFDVINARTTNWSVVPFPTPAWAAAAHPDLDPDAALAQLWQEVAHVCRLDEPDPSAAWRDRFDALAGAASRLTENRFDALHFEGPGTDLTVGLLPTSQFESGTATTVDGIVFGPNLPTEEVATTPDPLRVEGVVRSTRPLEVAGTTVRGLRVRFEEGLAVEIDADENAEVLRERCGRDEGASRLGEVALVDREGRIGRLGTVFCSTLLDENAASHVALGNAYASMVGKEDRGRINESAIHVDFMIGADDVAVTGLTSAGERVPVLRGGDWQL